jgi:hypothetical protein
MKSKITDCTIENQKDDNQAIHSTTWTRCIFDGPPPMGYPSWQDWADMAEKSGVHTGVKISAINKI